MEIIHFSDVHSLLLTTIPKQVAKLCATWRQLKVSSQYKSGTFVRSYSQTATSTSHYRGNGDLPSVDSASETNFLSPGSILQQSNVTAHSAC